MALFRCAGSMCFSPTASFATAVVLLPIGVWAVRLAQRREPARWLPLAVTPLLFAGQQALEGIVWLALVQAGPWLLLLRPVALAYLGFAFALWPVWLPWCALRLAGGQADLGPRRLMRLCWWMGWSLAMLLWTPLLLNPELIDPVVRHGSIDYQVQPFAAALPAHQPLTLVYLLIVCLPLLLTPLRRPRWLALALALSFVAAQIAFLHAFSSVWCYFSAVLSVLVVWVLGERPQAGPSPAPAEP